jgi:hypothetical protein
LAEGLEDAADLPHTISLAITYRQRINSFYELPKDKRPPRDLWDKPFRLNDFFDEVFKTSGTGNKVATYVEYNSEDVE